MRKVRPGFGLLLFFSFLVTIQGVLLTAVHAETRTAADLTPEAVWEAIDAAQDGDVVQLPAGTAVWKTGWNTNHWAEMKAITIRGAGIDKTIIRDATSETRRGAPFVVKGVEGKPFRISGITFDGTGLPDAGTNTMMITGNCKNFRIDHCKFLNLAHMIKISGDTYGLIDHCYFHALEKRAGLVQTIQYWGPGKVNFTKPLTLGTANAVYFEDNEAHFSPEVVNPTGNNPWIAPRHGARIVVRHNKIINTQLEIYRVNPPNLYGCQSAEVYDNAFSTEGVNKNRPQGFIFIGGGVAIVFNNTVTGTGYNCRVIELTHERSFRAFGQFGVCDGTNPIDGNQIPAGQKGAGYPCMGQPGRATDADGDGIFEPSPCYAWNNTFNGAKLKMALRRDSPEQAAEHVKEGRDFFNEAPKPEYYKPYTYPHPLQGGVSVGTIPPSAPAAEVDTGRAAQAPRRALLGCRSSEKSAEAVSQR